MKYGIMKRILSLVLCISMLIPMLTQARPVYSVVADDLVGNELSLNVTCPFDREIPFELNGSSVTSSSYRIPAMVTLDDGTIVAVADIRWNTTYDGGGLDNLVARSTDGGVTWSYTVANYLGDNGNQYNGASSTAFLDPNLVVGADGKTVYMLVDLYPYGVALNGSGHTQPTENVGFNDDGYLLLSGDNHLSYSYYLKEGIIYDSSDVAVEGYTVDEYFNITGPNGVNTNLFCEDSPYQVVRTGYLYLTSSTDGGSTWSAPTLLNVKTSSERVCLVAPGNSITTNNGTMIFPVYSYHGDNAPEGNTQRLSFIYSKDGVNWSRSSEFDYNWASEAAVVELENGSLRFFIRNGSKKLCYVDYHMENGWGSVVTLTDVNTNSNTQISAITYSKTSNGKQVVLVSCPTGPSRKGSNSSSASYRLNGSIFVFTVSSSGDMNLENTIQVNESDNQFMYSSLTERADGSIMILFEDKENGWGVGDNCYYTMDIKAYPSSDLGIKLDAPVTTIRDADGNVVTSVSIDMYEKVELSVTTKYFNTADVKHQWQIEYEEGKWVGIYGEDEKTIKLSSGMVATLLNDEGVVNIRCKSQAGSRILYSNVIPVTFVESDLKEVTVQSIAYSRMASSMMFASNNAATASETTTYNVIINYLNQNGSAVVADPYTSVVSPTTILTNTVTFPKIQGYVPMIYQGGVWVRSDSYTFDGTPFTEDFTLEVRYYPDAVQYTVNIYIQNAENDEYVLLQSYTREELTGTVIEGIEFPVDGFYQSKFSSNSDSASIAADGSTVFNLHYDRIYYLMKFDLDGGYGVQPIYARHGVKLEIPAPTKAGYTFVGWDQTEGKLAATTDTLNDGIQDTMHEYMPIGNTAYKAIWEAADNAKVTVVYWGENPNDEGYSYLESQELYVEPGTELTFGTNMLVCTLEAHTHDENCEPICGKEEHTAHTESCYTCDVADHTTHDTSCYDGVGNKQNVYTGVPDNPSEGYVHSHWRYGNLIYINGSWYRYSGSTASGQIASPTCHTHTEDCISSSCPGLHTHTADCYDHIAHTHTDACYLSTDGQDSALWTYVKSDTVTVAADGTTVMNVYYDRTTFTITFKETGNNGSELGTITDKWGADIRTRFENECKEHTFLWSRESDGSSPWTSFLDVMPQENRTYYAHISNNGRTQTAIYYGADLEGNYTITLYTSAVKYNNNLSVSEEEFIEIEGYVFNAELSTKENASFDGAEFYYDRANYTLDFNNGESAVKTESVPYETNLGTYAFTPTAPSIYEAGSVTFAGWYQNPECTGEEVVLSETTMPASSLLLYAKWVPVKHNVTVYRYKDANGLQDLLCNHTDKAIDGKEALGSVPHGDMLNKQYIPEEPTNGNYTFVTWAYDDANGNTVTIDINSFIVTQDVEIYAIWSSNVQIPYTIKYMIKGTTTEIAAPSEGKHYAGETHTFDAKTAGQLYKDYQTGYFPTVSSHSIDFKADDTSYEYTFYYVQKDAVPYTVYYVTEQQNAENSLTEITLTENGVEKTYYIVADTKTVSDNVNAIVTENFKTVQGYMPDAYQKTLIIDGSDGATNQIIFVYSVNTTQAYYKVNHYTKNPDGSWYTHASYENIGTIDDRYNEAPMTISGFTYSKTEYKVYISDSETPTDATDVTTEGAVLTADGLEINLYYTRNKYAYTVEYRVEGTTTVLYTVPDLEKQYYGETVYHEAPLYYGTGDIYQRVSAEKLSTVIQTDESKNLIIFYYEERQVTINYVVVNNFGGTVNPTEETVLISSGTAQGSTAEALPNYKFVGWYSDEACTSKISEELQFIPKKVDGLNVAATYYAKFDYNLTSLTIAKEGCDGADVNQSFLFKLTDSDGLELTVTVHGNGSITIDGLTVGKTYKIVEITSWSWRYDNNRVITVKTTVTLTETTVTDGAEFTLNPTGNTITFSNERSNPYWLDGDSWCNNIFK